MFNRTVTFIAALFIVGCSGGVANTEKDTPASETSETPETETHDSHGATDGLTLCTDTAAVPADATHCLLDLGTSADSHWRDSDGVDPGTAGCHYEFTDDTCGEVKTGRAFGEFCLDADRLVESNPGAGVCHTHGGDLGKPDVVSCSAWCASQGASAGRCEADVPAQGVSGECVSARCSCDA